MCYPAKQIYRTGQDNKKAQGLLFAMIITTIFCIIGLGFTSYCNSMQRNLSIIDNKMQQQTIVFNEKALLAGQLYKDVYNNFGDSTIKKEIDGFTVTEVFSKERVVKSTNKCTQSEIVTNGETGNSCFEIQFLVEKKTNPEENATAYKDSMYIFK